jgi:hypothetical protein
MTQRLGSKSHGQKNRNLEQVTLPREKDLEAHKKYSSGKERNPNGGKQNQGQSAGDGK